MKPRTTALVLTLALGAAACTSTTTTAGGGSSTSASKPATTGPSSGTTPTTTPDAKAPTLTAADIRTVLTLLLSEHVVLAADATGAALGGRTAEFEAAVAQLDKNSDALADAVGLVYGADKGKTFGPLWKKHIGFFVDYTKAVAANDQTAADKAVADLTAYAETFGAFLNSVSPELPTATVKDLVLTHILTLKAVVDAQAAKDPAKAFAKLGEAVDHMHAIADPLAGAIAKQFPQFAGDPLSKAADLQVALNALLQQHVAYAANATNAALGGRTDEFDAAVALLTTNTDDLSAAITAVAGQQTGDAFKGSWQKHIGFFVDYTTAIAKNDDAAKRKAAEDLNGYAGDLAAFFNSLLPDLPKATLQELIRGHIVGLEAAIDAQGAKDFAKAYAAMAEAMAHMNEIADPLAAAIAKAMPAKFPST